jgi:TetR/AcrR family transcriptional regulator, multidrug resistance operon repressor
MQAMPDIPIDNNRTFIHFREVRFRDGKKEQAIFDAAISLITANGFADTSMSKIAKSADVSPATIYIYFESKEDMLNKTYTHVKREMGAALSRGLKPELSVEEAFKVIWNNFYKYAVKNSEKFAFTEQFANSPLVDPVRKDEGMSYFQPLLEWFERGKKEKVFKNLPLEIFSAFAFAPLIGLVKQHFCGEVVLDNRLLKTIYDITWKAVAR